MNYLKVALPDSKSTDDMWELLFIAECLLRAKHKSKDFDEDHFIGVRNRLRLWLLAGIVVSPNAERDNVIPFALKTSED